MLSPDSSCGVGLLGTPMFFTTLRRLIRHHCRRAVAMAIIPLAILNGAPFAQGCICADGHYEPICRAAACRVGQSDCGRQCCAKQTHYAGHSCCTGPHAHHAAPTKPAIGQTFGNPCCTPVVHQAMPTVVAAPQVAPGDGITALNTTAVEPPYVLAVELMHVTHRAELGTGPPPGDLVVSLQRLVI